MLNKEQKQIVEEYSVNEVIIPEPPRGNSIRIFDRYSDPPFIVLGEPNPEWQSFASLLNTEKNYWDKTPITDEVMIICGKVVYLVRPEHMKYFDLIQDKEVVGQALFAEDTLNPKFISICRERAKERVETDLMSKYNKIHEGVAVNED